MGQEMQDFAPDASLASGAQDAPQEGPSWQRKGWSPADALAQDDLTSALDPMAMKAAIKAAVAKGAAPAPAFDEVALEQAASDSVRAMMLIRTYRVRGHLAADLDPLGLAHQVKVVRPVKKGQSLSWADVAMDTSTDAYKVRREMESMFALPLQKVA